MDTRLPAHPTVPHPAVPRPAAGLGGSEGKGAMGGGGRKRTSQPGSMPESDICQTPMLLLIKSGGQFAARRHPRFPHLPAAGAELRSPALEPLPPAPPALSWQSLSRARLDASFPFQTRWAAEQGGERAQTLIFLFYFFFSV